jgi:hypothetical protein
MHALGTDIEAYISRMQAAAQQVLEWGEDVPRQEAAWRSSRAEAEAASAREAAAAALERRRVCARFNLQVMPPSKRA